MYFFRSTQKYSILLNRGMDISGDTHRKTSCRHQLPLSNTVCSMAASLSRCVSLETCVAVTECLLFLLFRIVCVSIQNDFSAVHNALATAGYQTLSQLRGARKFYDRPYVTLQALMAWLYFCEVCSTLQVNHSQPVSQPKIRFLAHLY